MSTLGLASFLIAIAGSSALLGCGSADVETDAEEDLVEEEAALDSDDPPGGGGSTGGSGALLPPNLFPKPPFCNFDLQGKLIVKIQNSGTTAYPSVTRVEFFPGGIVDKYTPALAKNSTAYLYVSVPLPCFNPGCDFRIAADDAGQIAESAESDNYADGIVCY